VTLASSIRGALRRAGIDVRRAENMLGRGPFDDIARLTGGRRGVTVIDAGANVGQSVERFRHALDEPVVHSFEPGAAAFAELTRRAGGLPGVTLNNCGLAARPGELELVENTTSLMNSFLEPGPDYWGEVSGRRPVPVTTVDAYCAERGIGAIDVLKTDTQGFDLEVLSGADALIAGRRVHLVYMEINYAEHYAEMPALDAVYRFMRERGFFLVAFYDFAFKQGRAEWSDALFVQPEYPGPDAG
jgi:FkbM family methyltransferase